MYNTEFLDIPPLQYANGEVTLPGSKSISNRVLLLAALSHGKTRIHDLLDSDDTRVMLDALRALGCPITLNENVYEIEGLSGHLPSALSNAQEKTVLFLGNAGTAMRPLTAALSLLGGSFELRGIARMHERPIGDLVDALRSLGCSIACLQNEGFPPLLIEKPDLDKLNQAITKPILIRGDVSSQFLTALLLTLPLIGKRIELEVAGDLISKPYIEITLQLLQQFGIKIERNEWKSFVIPAHSRYESPRDVYVEADASSASYFVALGALAAFKPNQNQNQQDDLNQQNHLSIRINGVGLNSIQGDIRFIEAARLMGAKIEGGANYLTVSRGVFPLKAIDLDCNHIPDAAMTLAIMALFADAPSTLRNIASWRVKETDRIHAMATECRKLGARVEEGNDWLKIHPIAANEWQNASIHTYDDHRMAMCFSLAAFNPASAKAKIRIEDPKCVAKTFPDYFETLFSLSHADEKHIPVICIDGPTASGKGTLAKAVAARLGYHWLDSGALYRLVAFAATQAKIDTKNEADLLCLIQSLSIQFDDEKIWLNQSEVSASIRSEAIGMRASEVAKLPLVRQALLQLQLSFKRLPGLVADGRDMGSVVFSQAPLKVFLTASTEERAKRRYEQLISKGISASIAGLRADLQARDEQDQNRAIAPLKAASDAFLLDNSHLSIDECVNQVLIWWNKQNQHQNLLDIQNMPII